MPNEIYVSSIVRNTGEQKEHGSLRKIDWDTKQVVAKVDRVFPWQFCTRSSNTRGGIRGWRSILIGVDSVIAANYDALCFYDLDLDKVKKVVTHPSVADIHGMSYSDGLIHLTSTINDMYVTIDPEFNYTLSPLLDNKVILDACQPWIEKAGKSAASFDVSREYRAEWTGDVVHFNYVKTLNDGKVVAFFNYLNMLIQIEPEVKILWAPELEWESLTPADGVLGFDKPHDIIEIDDNTLLVCSSDEGVLYKFDYLLKKFHKLWQSPEPAGKSRWIRGLDVVGSSVFVGTGHGKIFEIGLDTGETIYEMKAFEDWFDLTHTVFGLAHTSGRHRASI